MSILLVDDSKTFLDLLNYTLIDGGFSNIETAYDGLEGYNMAMKKKYSLIIIDYNMPKLNGIQLIKKLRNEDRYKRIPLLILSTETDDKLKMKARDAGATGWMTKPFLPREVIKAVGICLNKK